MNKGFTLIELLAVIVILAIIAVIAVPIVIDIIDDSKKNASLRSAEMYMDAVEMSVAQSALKGQNIQKGVYYIMNDGNICLKNYNKETKQCTDTDNIDDNEILKVEVKGETPKEGTITIKDGNISNVDFEVSENRVIKNDKGEIIYFPCTLISGEENEIGSKYECEVKSGTKYNFYVLSYNDVNNESTNDKNKAVTTNLIMDRNIYYNSATGEKGLTDENHKGHQIWGGHSIEVSTGESITFNDYGPVDALDYLYNATKDWTNIPNIIVNYDDTISYTNVQSTYGGYGTIITIDNKTVITMKDKVTVVEVNNGQDGYIDLKVRMPYKSEVDDYSEEKNNKFLYDNLACLDFTSEGGPYNCIDGLTHIDEIYGYWTISTDVEYDFNAWFVCYLGKIISTGVTNPNEVGVRPVINLKI